MLIPRVNTTGDIHHYGSRQLLTIDVVLADFPLCFLLIWLRGLVSLLWLSNRRVLVIWDFTAKVSTANSISKKVRISEIWDWNCSCYLTLLYNTRCRFLWDCTANLITQCHLVVWEHAFCCVYNEDCDVCSSALQVSCYLMSARALQTIQHCLISYDTGDNGQHKISPSLLLMS